MADKTKSIKNATDKELDDLLMRLRKESEVQNLIGDLKRKSEPKDAFGNYVSWERPEVSTEKPIETLYHNADDVLAHFGILGMRWGVRRATGPNGLVKRTPLTEKSEDYIKTKELRTKGHEALSTKDLKDVTARLQLEKQYKDLTKKEISAGKKWVYDVIGGALKEQAKSQVSKLMGKGIDELLKKAAK